MADLDPHIHPPTRLRLMTSLTPVTDAEFCTIRDALGVSDSVLSKHVSALAEVGYVGSRKGVHGGRRTTWVRLTPVGRRALGEHAAALRALIVAVPTDSEPVARRSPAPVGRRSPPSAKPTSRQTASLDDTARSSSPA